MGWYLLSFDHFVLAHGLHGVGKTGGFVAHQVHTAHVSLADEMNDLEGVRSFHVDASSFSGRVGQHRSRLRLLRVSGGLGTVPGLI